jgi:hypothetical protein
MSGLAPVTDISERIFNVRFVPQADFRLRVRLAMSNVVHSSAVYRQHLCRDPARLR